VPENSNLSRHRRNRKKNDKVVTAVDA